MPDPEREFVAAVGLEYHLDFMSPEEVRAWENAVRLATRTLARTALPNLQGPHPPPRPPHTGSQPSLAPKKATRWTERGTGGRSPVKTAAAPWADGIPPRRGRVCGSRLTGGAAKLRRLVRAADPTHRARKGGSKLECIHPVRPSSQRLKRPGVKGGLRDCLDQSCRARRPTAFLQDREEDNAGQQELRPAGGGKPGGAGRRSF